MKTKFKELGKVHYREREKYVQVWRSLRDGHLPFQREVKVEFKERSY